MSGLKAVHFKSGHRSSSFVLAETKKNLTNHVALIAYFFELSASQTKLVE